MRDNFSMLPIVQDSLNGPSGCLSNISSNGYYGFQPLSQKNGEAQCLMEVQFESRKRCWEYSDEYREFKKRRQNEASPFVHQQSSDTPNRDVKLRKPTHNIPDMPRCIMGHYI